MANTREMRALKTVNGNLAFVCECGKTQAFAPPDSEAVGVSVEDALDLGWGLNESGEWSCPFCTGAACGETPAWSESDLAPIRDEEHGGEG